MTNASSHSLNMLVAPLDWGLGHAARCVPLVQALLDHGCRVVLAAEGPQAQLLAEAFPDLEILPLPGYRITYSRRGVWWKILWQLPKLQLSIRREHRWLEQLLRQRSFDAVISDNRYGFWSRRCASVILTHQLQPALPRGMSWLQGLARRTFYRLLQPFDACWVPDVADAAQGLSGQLGHPRPMPSLPVQYLGWLTRFRPASPSSPARWHLLVVLSGPEPQRSLLEARVLAQLPAVERPVLLVRGLPGETEALRLPAPHQAVNHLPGPAMQQEMQAAEFVLCRGGYSTLMDAFTLGKKCLLVPTLGQTEQEYLAQKLQEQGAALCFQQRELQLKEVLERAAAHHFRLPAVPAETMSAFVGQWLQSPEFGRPARLPLRPSA